MTKAKPTHMWKDFFARLLGRKNAETYSTEHYVAAFGESFKLAKSYYHLGGKIVLL